MVTRLHGYKVTRLQGYNRDWSAAPPFGGTGEQFPIPKCKEMTKTAAIPAFCSPVEGGAALP